MSRTPRRRPSPALLISILALVMAMGGSSVAQDVVADISAKIQGKRIANNAITSKKIKNGTIKAIDAKAGAFLTPAAGNAAFQPKGNYQAAGNYLAGDGKAVDADKLDGIDSTGFLAADGKAVDSDTLDGTDSSNFQRGVAYHGDARMTEHASNTTTLITIANRLRIRGQCLTGDPPTPEIHVEHLVDWDGGFFTRDDTDLPGNAFAPASVLQNGDTQEFTSGAGDVQEVTEHVYRDGILLGSEFVELHAFSGDADNETCVFTAVANHRDTRAGFIFTPGPIILDPSPRK
jgi:hypothetical protein